MNPLPMQKKQVEALRKRPAPMPDAEMMKEPPKRDAKKQPVMAKIDADDLEV